MNLKKIFVAFFSALFQVHLSPFNLCSCSELNDKIFSCTVMKFTQVQINTLRLLDFSSLNLLMDYENNMNIINQRVAAL